MNVLGIETSCDETSVAIVRDGRTVLSNSVFSQIALHRPYGGVVPEIACRSHVETLPSVLEDAVAKAGVGWNGIDAVAFTHGPGLASSLLVGVSAAKGLAIRLNKPLIAVNHIEAHMYSIFLGDTAPLPADLFPFIALVVSGGHSCLVRVEALGRYILLGQTIDDAAGEAFDKGANILGLGYPGGPLLDKISRSGDPAAINFPRGRQRKDKSRFSDLNTDMCFSFSGLKTALLYYIKSHPLSESKSELPSIAASYQEAIVDGLIEKCGQAVSGMKHLACVGGVSLNSRLRTKLAAFCSDRGIALHLAAPQFCADNAAMVAGLAGAGRGVQGEEAMAIDAEPSIELTNLFT